jgi:hypothetical protein
MFDWINNLDPTWQFALFSAAKILAAFAVFMAMVAYVVLAPNAASARPCKGRIGPNRAGPVWIAPAHLGRGESVLQGRDDSGDMCARCSISSRRPSC